MRKITILISTALILFMSVRADALIFGIRYSDLSQATLPGIEDNSSRGRFGAYLGFREKNSLFLVGADYDRYKMERGDSLLYARRLVVNIGYRYHLLNLDKAEAMDFMPFVSFHLFKGFSKLSADSVFMPPADVKYLKDILNDSGGWLSLGAEYKFAPAFGFGGEAGIRYTRARSKAYGYEVKISQYSSFVALIMTFYW